MAIIRLYNNIEKQNSNKIWQERHHQPADIISRQNHLTSILENINIGEKLFHSTFSFFDWHFKKHFVTIKVDWKLFSYFDQNAQFYLENPEVAIQISHIIPQVHVSGSGDFGWNQYHNKNQELKYCDVPPYRALVQSDDEEAASSQPRARNTTLCSAPCV